MFFFYRPLGASGEVISSLDSILATFPDYSIIFARDVNWPNLKWNGNIPSSGISFPFPNVISTYDLEHYVLTATRGANVLDKILCNDPSVVQCVSVYLA